MRIAEELARATDFRNLINISIIDDAFELYEHVDGKKALITNAMLPSIELRDKLVKVIDEYVAERKAVIDE